METNKGLFLVLESEAGIERDAQVELLKTRLEAAGHTVKTYFFPYIEETSGHFVKSYQRGDYGVISNVSPYTASLFYALDHYQKAVEISSALQAGEIVLASSFSGAYMASEGRKFEHPEERRGYFIWNDNLAFEMLKMPRPDKNYVLQFGASQDDLLTESFRELCRLFPKDFQEIACERSGKVLARNTVHDLLWKLVEPYVPELRSAPTKTAASAPGMLRSGTNKQDLHITDVTASKLVLPFLHLQDQSGPSTGQSGYYVPPSLGKPTAAIYRKSLDTILKLHNQALRKVQAHLAHTGKTSTDTAVQAICQAILPLAVKQKLDVHATDLQLKQLLIQLMSAEPAEAVLLAESVLKQARQLDPSFMSSDSELTQSNQAIEEDMTLTAFSKKQASAHLSQVYGQHNDSVRLAVHYPRNEFDLLPELLYSSSGLSISEIDDQVGRWHYDTKEKLFSQFAAKLLGAHNTVHQPLQAAVYTFDLLTDYPTFSALAAHAQSQNLSWQQANPGYGYAIPEIVEAAGASDLFETCFDTSLELYSRLQSEKYDQEAQYATLLGHRMRWKMTINVCELNRLVQAAANTKFTKTAHHMQAAVAEVHPLLGAQLQATVSAKTKKAKPIAKVRKHA